MKIGKLSVFCIIFFNLISNLHSQNRTLEGTVREADRTPISGVIIQIEDTNISTKTDANGHFQLNNVPDLVFINLVFTHPDMETKKITAGLKNIIDVVLIRKGIKTIDSFSLEEILNIEVTVASKSSEKLMDAPGIVSVVSRDELERFGGLTLSDVLERVPGLNISTSFFTDRSIISIRGDQIKISGSHVLFLINGRPVREIIEGGISCELLESFPIDIIERIEVIKGPGSVLYGNNAFSGVINIITKKDKNGVSASALAGNGGSVGGAGDFGMHVSGLNIVGAVQYLKRADWDVSYEYSTSSGVTTRSDFTIPNKGVGAYLGADYKGFKLTSSFNQWITQNLVRGSFGGNKWEKYFANLGYGIQISERWNMDFNLSYTPVKFKTVNNLIKRSSSEIVAEWNSFLLIGKKSKLVVGGLYNKIKGKEIFTSTNPVSITSDGKRYDLGLYGQINFSVTNDLNFIGGIQVNKVENVDLNVVPRAGIIWYPFHGLNIKALYSQAFRAASINELGLVHPSLMGNPDLVPEEVGNIDLSVSYQKDQFQLRTNYFNSRMTNMIVAYLAIEPGIYLNSGEINISGFELEGKYYLNKNILITASTLYQNNKDSEGNENVMPIANVGIKTGVSYQNKNGITISFFDIYQGQLDKRYETRYNPSPGPYNKLNVYCAFNISKMLKMNAGPILSVFLQGDNMLNEEIWLSDCRTTPGTSGESIPFDPGRMIYTGVKVTL